VRFQNIKDQYGTTLLLSGRTPLHPQKKFTNFDMVISVCK